MADLHRTQGRPFVLGANHRSSSMALRDRLVIEDAALPDFLNKLKEHGFDQALVLSTCDRIEVQSVHPDPEGAAQTGLRLLAEQGEMAHDELDGHFYTLKDDEALRHIFAVPASLDSLVIGETQVFGQVKACLNISAEAGLLGPELDAIVQAALKASKRVRTETEIGRRPVSISTAALGVARGLHGDLDRCAGLLIGCGNMGETVAQDMVAANLGTLMVLHPKAARAEAAARALDCHWAPFESLPEAIARADIVLSSLGSRQYIVAEETVAAALKKRRNKPIFFVDAGIPGDIDPAVERCDGAFLYNLDDLERVAMEGRAKRRSVSGKAWEIIDAEVDAFLKAKAEKEK